MLLLKEVSCTLLLLWDALPVCWNEGHFTRGMFSQAGCWEERAIHPRRGSALEFACPAPGAASPKCAQPLLALLKARPQNNYSRASWSPATGDTARARVPRAHPGVLRVMVGIPWSPWVGDGVSGAGAESGRCPRAVPR